MRAAAGPTPMSMHPAAATSEAREANRVACYSFVSAGDAMAEPKLVLLKGADSLLSRSDAEVAKFVEDNKDLTTPSEAMAKEIELANQGAQGEGASVTVNLSTIIYLNIVDTNGKVCVVSLSPQSQRLNRTQTRPIIYALAWHATSRCPSEPTS